MQLIHAATLMALWCCGACTNRQFPALAPRHAGPAGANACLPREPRTVALVGVIERATFPGPPNYESVAQGDAAETCWLLRLLHPLCLDAQRNLAGAIDDEKHSNVEAVQLVFADGSAYVKYRGLVGERTRASGGLFGAETGHHHTEVLLTVSELAAAR